MLTFPAQVAIALAVILYRPGAVDGNPIIRLGTILLFNTIAVIYFYRRRAMFGAKRRWTSLETLCPFIVGPEQVTRRPLRSWVGETPSVLLGAVALVILLVLGWLWIMLSLV